jgi:hypothetical protein
MTTAKTKTQARRTGAAAKRTTRQAATTGRQAERTARTVVLDGAYATLGLTDSAVEFVRGLPAAANQLRVQAPKRLASTRQTVQTLADTAPRRLEKTASGLRRTAEERFDTLAARGRKVYRSVRTSKATERAVGQAKTARSQVKAARTSVRRAAGEAATAVEDAGGKVGARNG